MKGMFSCKQVTQFISESLDRKLPFLTRMQLKMHLGMCGVCKAFRKNMVRIDKEVRQHAEELEQDVQDSDVRLSPDARNRLNETLNSNGR